MATQAKIVVKCAGGSQGRLPTDEVGRQPLAAVPLGPGQPREPHTPGPPQQAANFISGREGYGAVFYSLRGRRHCAATTAGRERPRRRIFSFLAVLHDL